LKDGINSFAPGRTSIKKSLKISDVVVGKTKVHFNTIELQPQGCCGNLLCMYEPVVTGIGSFTNQNGEDTELLQLDNGMFITLDVVDFFC
jgi:hypothetical protein